MLVKEAILSRRAIRNYLDEMVPEHTVRELIDAAIQAPSAVNAQPWAFVVIQDKDLLRRLSDRAKDLMSAEMRGHFGNKDEFAQFNIFYNASTLIILCATPQGVHPQWDCCLAGENLLLAATEMGLGTCVIGLSWDVLSLPDVKDELGIPEDYQVVLPIIVGMPKEKPATHPRRPAEILSWKVPVWV